MMAAAGSSITIELISVFGAASIAAIGGAVTLYQLRTVGRRAVQRDDFAAVWGEVRLRDEDAERLRSTISNQFEQLQLVRETNIRLEGELAVARAQVLQLTTELAHIREQGGPGVYHS